MNKYTLIYKAIIIHVTKNDKVRCLWRTMLVNVEHWYVWSGCMGKWCETMPACCQPHCMRHEQHFNIKWIWRRRGKIANFEFTLLEINWFHLNLWWPCVIMVVHISGSNCQVTIRNTYLRRRKSSIMLKLYLFYLLIGQWKDIYSQRKI